MCNEKEMRSNLSDNQVLVPLLRRSRGSAEEYEKSRKRKYPYVKLDMLC